jgi:hypothetical protein
MSVSNPDSPFEHDEQVPRDSLGIPIVESKFGVPETVEDVAPALEGTFTVRAATRDPDVWTASSMTSAEAAFARQLVLAHPAMRAVITPKDPNRRLAETLVHRGLLEIVE